MPAASDLPLTLLLEARRRHDRGALWSEVAAPLGLAGDELRDEVARRAPGGDRVALCGERGEVARLTLSLTPGEARRFSRALAAYLAKMGR